MRFKTMWRTGAVLAAAFLGGVTGSWLLQAKAPEASVVNFGERGDESGVVGTFGVGGVLTWEGELWQYRPDKQKWMTLDESFALEGQATKVVPLPVQPQDIRYMETFGFLVARNDDCWLYDIDQQRWNNLGKPPFHARRR